MAESNELPDQYIVLLEEVVKSNRALIAENKAMRLEMETKGEMHGQALKDLDTKLLELSNRPQTSRGQSDACTGRRSRARAARVKVPSACKWK
jgi:hypothetical protein